MWRIAPELALLCAGVTVDRGVLPKWAWTGPQPKMRHVVARDGRSPRSCSVTRCPRHRMPSGRG
jgi:hypothetical protein